MSVYEASQDRHLYDIPEPKSRKQFIQEARAALERGAEKEED